MMSKKSPQLRFEGFTDDWEERKLSSISERVTRKNKNNESTLPLTISAQDGLIDQNDFFNKQVASRDVTGYFLVKNGEFAYNKSYSNGYPWGAIKRLDKYDMGVLSTLYIVFRPTEINSQFLVSYYDTTRWYREVSKNAAEGARNHGLLNIAPTDFFNTLLVVPKIVDEQEKIGSFFKQMDNTIALHQRKLDMLKEQKKGYLQKMVPKNGAKVPELRFAGFADDWEERKVKDIFKITRGQVLAATKTSEEKSDISPFPVYSSQTKNNGLMGYYKDYLFDTAITWTTDGANAGTVSYRSGRFYSTNVNGVLISDKGYTNKAISEILNLEAWKWVSHVGNPKLMNNVMGDISIMIPSSFEEQDRLSDFLNQLDDTIDLHQRKLDLLKEQKKGFLQKMFV